MYTFRKNLLTAFMIAMLALGVAACGGDEGEAEVETDTGVATEAMTEMDEMAETEAGG